MIEEQIFDEIKKAKSILLHLHPSPDCDSQGSALAMYHALTSIGKKVTVIKGDSDIQKSMSHLPGADKIISKNFLEVDQKEFDLFLILDTADRKRVTNIADFEFLDSMMTIVIDHHISNPKFGKLNLVDSNVPATAAILFTLFKKWNIPITNEIARNLLLGIYTDTGNFTHNSTTKEMFSIAVELMDYAPEIFSDLSQVYMITADTLRFESIAFKNIEMYGEFALSVVSYEELQKEKIELDAVSASRISGILKSLYGVTAAGCLVEEEKDIIKMSFRSRNPDVFDVSKLASKLGGGGHRAAAGVLLKTTLSDAKQRVLFLVNQYTK